MDFPRIRSTFGVTPYAPGRKRPVERDEEDTIADIPNPEMMQKEPEIYDRPFPPGVAMQEAFDDMLQRRIVDPLAKAGYEDVGAGFAAIPSAAHSMIVPQSEFDVAGTLIPLPGVAKLMKKGKFRKISKAMHIEDPENAAEIIAKQAGKAEPTELPTGGSYRDVTKETLEQESNLLKKDPLKYHNQKEKEFIEAARKLIDPTSEPISNGKKVGGPRHPAHEGYRPLPGKEEQFKALLKKAEEHGQEWEKLKQRPKAEVRAIDEKEMLRKADESNAREADQKAKMKQDTADIEAGDPNHPQRERLDRIKASLSKIDELMGKLKKGEPVKPPLKVVEPPKPPKGDPEASLPRQPDEFSAIRSQLDVAPSRMDERGKAFGDVGQSEFTPYDRPSPQFEEIQKRNYVESEMDPVQQTITKILGLPENAELSPQQKQALADFVRYRYKTNADMTMDVSFDQSRNIKDAPQSIRGVTGESRDLYDRDLYRIGNKIDPYWSDEGYEAHKKLNDAFGPDQEIIRHRHPSVKKMFDVLRDDQPFGRNDTSFDRTKELQDKMYKGRPSHEAEQAKLFPKVKEAVSVKKLFQKPDGSLVDENGKVVMTKEEAERLMYEKLKDF
jgi:hypothetical protein